MPHFSKHSPRYPVQSQHHKENDSRGFTLLELIIVCALIGIMLTVSVPSLRSAFFTNPLKSSARQVIGITNEARQKAVRSQQPYHLHLSRLENRLWYETINPGEVEDEDDGLGQNKTRELQLPTSIRLSNLWLKSSGVVSEDKTSIWISKKGYMEQAAIQLSDELGNSLSIQLNPFTDPIAVSEDFPPDSPSKSPL